MKYTINSDIDSSEYKVKKVIDRKEYMKEYRKNNMDKWKEIKVCIHCGNTYSSSNSGNHLKSKKHKYGVIEKENIKLQKIKAVICSN